MVHGGAVYSASFSLDSRRVLTRSKDKTARVWDVENAKPTDEALQVGGLARISNFSPDGRRVLTQPDDKTVRVWEAESGTPVGEPMVHDGAVKSSSFSPDGRRVLTAQDNTVRVWDAETGKPLSEPLVHAGLVYSASFSSDGGSVLTQSEGWRVWRLPWAAYDDAKALISKVCRTMNASAFELTDDDRKVVPIIPAGAVGTSVCQGR